MVDKNNSGKKKVIRIHDDGPFGWVCYDRRYFLEEAVYTYDDGMWRFRWVRVDGQPKHFGRRCDASRWAGRHYPEWERQHWYTL